jgi:hypothetical protein
VLCTANVLAISSYHALRRCIIILIVVLYYFCVLCYDCKYVIDCECI